MDLLADEAAGCRRIEDGARGTALLNRILPHPASHSVSFPTSSQEDIFVSTQTCKLCGKRT